MLNNRKISKLHLHSSVLKFPCKCLITSLHYYQNVTGCWVIVLYLLT